MSYIDAIRSQMDCLINYGEIEPSDGEEEVNIQVPKEFGNLCRNLQPRVEGYAIREEVQGLTPLFTFSVKPEALQRVIKQISRMTSELLGGLKCRRDIESFFPGNHLHVLIVTPPEGIAQLDSKVVRDIHRVRAGLPDCPQTAYVTKPEDGSVHVKCYSEEVAKDLESGIAELQGQVQAAWGVRTKSAKGADSLLHS